MHRRTFLNLAAGAAVGGVAAQAPLVPIIDTHIHLFDPTRPQGVPWPDKANSVLYRPALPERYRQIAVPLGVRGAIEIECSPWLEDNQWVLDVAEKDPIMVGTIGDLEPDKPEFGRQLERFHRNPLFLGIRYGNLWGRDLGSAASKPEFIAGLKLLADAGLVLDTANPDVPLLEAVVRITDRAPGLRVVIDHLPQLNPPPNAAAHKAYDANLRELARRPQVFVKISQVLQHVDGRVPEYPAFYRARLDSLYDIFGEDRLLYGSDWPNSDQWGSYAAVFNVVRNYFAAKGRAVEEKYFWKNAVKAYRWVKRESDQPQA